MSALQSQALAYFVTISELGSLTAAAKKLRVSQPSLSVAVKKLEDELQTQLLVRNRSGVVLTSTGEALVRHARHALETLDLAREEIHSLQDEPRGRFTLGCHESLAAYCLPGFMAKFLGAHPQIQLSLWNGNSREVEQAVVDRTVDIGLVVNAAEHGDCVVQPLFRDRVELIVRASLRPKHRSAADLLSSHPVVFVPALRQAQYLLAALAQKGHTVHRPLPCSSMELVKSLVIDGVGVGILPFRVASHGVAAGVLTPVSPQLPHYDDNIALVRRYDMHMTAAARIVLDALREHGRAMPPLPRLRG